MQKDQLDGLLVLKLVAEKKSFASAALVLGISASAVSQIVKVLESRLGIALLTRTTRKVSLTEAGERFLKEAGPAIDRILAAASELTSYSQKPSGLLRITLPKIVFWTYLSPLLLGFRKKYPDISVEVRLEDAHTDVVQGGFDAGIRLADILAKDMVALKLYGPIRFVIAATPKYWNRAGRPKHPQDLLQHDCLRFRLGEGFYDNWEFESKGKEFSVHVNGSLILNDSNALLKAAEDGHGVLYTDEDTIRQYLGKGKLELALENYAATSSGYYLYYPKVSQVQPKLRAFIDYLQEFQRR